MRGEKDEVEECGAVAEDSPRRRGGAEKSKCLPRITRINADQNQSSPRRHGEEGRKTFNRKRRKERKGKSGDRRRQQLTADLRGSTLIGKSATIEVRAKGQGLRAKS